MGLIHDGTETFIYRSGKYLSGKPYLWSHFPEKAFIFRDADQAKLFIAEFPCLKWSSVRAFKARPVKVLIPQFLRLSI